MGNTPKTPYMLYICNIGYVFLFDAIKHTLRNVKADEVD